MKVLLTTALFLCTTISAQAGIIEFIKWGLSSYVKIDFKATCYDSSKKLKFILIDRRYDGPYELQDLTTDIYLENLTTGKELKREYYNNGQPGTGPSTLSPLQAKFDGSNQALVSYLDQGDLVEVEMVCAYKWSKFQPARERAYRAKGVNPNDTYGSLSDMN